MERFRRGIPSLSIVVILVMSTLIFGLHLLFTLSTLTLFICFNICIAGFILIRRGSTRKLLFIASLLFFIVLIASTMNLSTSWAQEKPPQTVYVTVVRTVLVRETVLMRESVAVYKTVTEVTTNVNTFLSTATTTVHSISLNEVTVRNTISEVVTSIITEGGVIRDALNYPFGPYYDLALVVLSAAGGAAFAFGAGFLRRTPSADLERHVEDQLETEGQYCTNCGRKLDYHVFLSQMPECPYCGAILGYGGGRGGCFGLR